MKQRSIVLSEMGSRDQLVQKAHYVAEFWGFLSSSCYTRKNAQIVCKQASHFLFNFSVRDFSGPHVLIESALKRGCHPLENILKFNVLWGGGGGGGGVSASL